MEKKSIENLEEELKRIKEEIEKRKNKTKETDKSVESDEKTVYEVIKSHIEKNPPESLDKKYRLTGEEIKTYVSNLDPEEDDRKIAELFNIAMEHGIINAVHICEKLNNPHILDDFHRRLAHYFNFETVSDKKEKDFKMSSYITIGIAAVIIIVLILIIIAN